MKYVLVSGGVISGIGKGIIASSTGLLLQTMGLSVTSIKIDGYLNVDAGTMSPVEHGEVFTTDDGSESDLDIGNYERYLGIKLTRAHNLTTGKIYQHVIDRERKGEYLGKTVQIISHLCSEIVKWCEEVAKIIVEPEGKRVPDVCIIELGGCVGDMEVAPWAEGMRQLRQKVGPGNFFHIFVSLLPLAAGDQKTKPTQQAVRESRSVGLSPDLIACRCSEPLERATIEKIAMFCQVGPEHVITVHDVSSTYHVPMLLRKQNYNQLLWDGLRLDTLAISATYKKQGELIWKQWTELTGGTDQHYEQLDIALVGKYSNHKESYISVIKSLEHAAMAIRRRLNVVYVDASHLEPPMIETDPAKYHQAWTKLCTAHGILVPGGFGGRGSEGMISAANWARTKDIPYLGICFGFQMASIEYARNVCGISNATSAEFDKEAINPVILPMEDIDQDVLGGTMRLGLQVTRLQPDSKWSKLRALYDRARKATENPPNGTIANGTTHSPQDSLLADPEVILERHRHRFEINPKFIPQFTKDGLHFIGKDDKGLRMEIFEVKDKRFYVGVQYHPEYLSKVLRPSPVYLGFVAASAGCLEDILGSAQDRPLSHKVNGASGL